MAARKKSTVKKSTRRATSGAASRLSRLTQDLPPTLVDFQKRMQKQLNALEREIDRRQAATRKQAAHLLRQASHQLGRLEAQGEGAWARLTTSARKELLRLLRRLETAIEPGARTRRVKATARKATARVKKVLSDAASTIAE